MELRTGGRTDGFYCVGLERAYVYMMHVRDVEVCMREWFSSKIQVWRAYYSGVTAGDMEVNDMGSCYIWVVYLDMNDKIKAGTSNHVCNPHCSSLPALRKY